MQGNIRQNNPAIILYSLLILAGSILGRCGIPWDYWAFISIVSCVLVFTKSDTRLLVPVSILLLMSTWSALKNQTFETRDLMVYTGYDTDPVLVHMEGLIIRVQGNRIDLKTEFSIEDDIRRPVSGRIVVRLPTSSNLFGPGDVVSIKGWLHGIQDSRRSDPDWKSIAINGDYRGWMRLESMELIRITRIHEPTIWNSLKPYAIQTLLSQPVPGHGSARELLAALLLGQRGESWNEVSRPFRETGVSHLLAISGLHVGLVLFMFTPMVAIGGERRRWHSIFAILILTTYLSIIEMRTPIMRAGIMSAFFYVPFTFYRRIPVKGVLAFTMSLLLILNPSILSQISFQLSFGVVAALVLLAPQVHRRYFTSIQTRPSSPCTFLSTWIKRSISASTVAWLISIPITIHHFGQASLLSVPMTLILTPMVCVILFTSSFRLIFGQIDFIDESAGYLLVNQIHVLESFTKSVARIPFVSIEDIQTDSVWTILSLSWIACWCLADRWRILLLPSFIALITWILITNISG